MKKLIMLLTSRLLLRQRREGQEHQARWQLQAADEPLDDVEFILIEMKK